MKKMLFRILLHTLLSLGLSLASRAQTTVPLSLSAIKAQITTKLTPVGTDRITAQKQRDLMNTIAEQLDLKGSAADVATRTQYLALSGVRSFSLGSTFAPAVINLTDKGKHGIFVLDVADDSSADNTGRILRTASGLCYKRVVWGGQIQLEWYGAKGDGSTDDTQAVQNAINDAILAARANDGEMPKFKQPGTLIVPVGTFKINTVTVYGSIRIVGQGGGTYAGSFFQQRTAGQSILVLGPDGPSYGSNSTVIENICFKSAVASVSNTVAQIKTLPGIASNSVYIRHCWFKTPEAYAIWLTQGDDIQIHACTFDVSPFHAIRLGNGAGSNVTNYSIQLNDFYDIDLRCIELDNVQGGIISGNRVDRHNKLLTSQFINGQDGTVNGLIVSGNEGFNQATLAAVNATAKSLKITNNNFINARGQLLAILGGTTLDGADISHNSFRSDTAFAASPINGTGSGLTNSVIIGNVISSGVTTASAVAAINLPDGRTTGNEIIHNTSPGFVTRYNVANPEDNQILNFKYFVRGSNETATTTSTNANEYRRSGFYSTTDNTNQVATGGWFNLGFTATWPGVVGTLSNRWQLDANPSDGKIRSRFYFSGAFTNYYTLHDNRWFNVSETLGNQAGRVLYDNGTSWSSAPFVHPNGTTVSSGTQQLAVNMKYVVNFGASRSVLTLPATATPGDQIRIVGYSPGGWRIAQNASNVIHTGISGSAGTTAGTGGYIDSGSQYDTITLEYLVSGEWYIIAYTSSSGLGVH